MKLLQVSSVRDILHKNLNMVWIQHIKSLLELRHKKSNIYSLIHELTPPPQYIFIYILLHSKTLTDTKVQGSTDRKYKFFLSPFGTLEVAWLRDGFQIIISLIIFTHFLLWLFQPPHLDSTYHPPIIHTTKHICVCLSQEANRPF